MKTSGIIFDLDDTLYDQQLPFYRTVQLLFPACAWPIEDIYKQSRHYSDQLWPAYCAGDISLHEVRIRRIQMAFQDYGLTLFDDPAAHFQEQYERQLASITLFKEAVPLFTLLREKGYLLGIITNGPIEHQLSKIRRLGLLEWFDRDRILISDEIGTAKPEQEIFQHYSKHIGIAPPQLIYIGDSWQNDVVPSIESGWRSIWLNHRGRQPATSHHPLGTIDSLDMIPNLLISAKK